MLPQDLRDIVFSTSWQETIAGLIHKFNLTREQGVFLKHEVLIVLLGLIHPNAFRDEVTNRLSGVSADALDSIATTIEDVVLGPVYETLVAFFDAERSRSGEFSNPTPTSPPELAAPETLILTTPIPRVAPQAPAQPTSVFEEKLKRVFTVPREESRVASTPTVPVAPKAPTPPAAPRPGSDPYREPLT